MRKIVNATALAIGIWAFYVVLFSYLDNHCDGKHATECAAEYGLGRRCSLGLDDHP